MTLYDPFRLFGRARGTRRRGWKNDPITVPRIAFFRKPLSFFIREKGEKDGDHRAPLEIMNLLSSL
jgi:hypothetical protein